MLGVSKAKHSCKSRLAPVNCVGLGLTDASCCLFNRNKEVVKHEPRQAIHTEKQLASAHKLDGAESLGICKAGQTVLARSMETQIWHKLADSVGGGFRKEIMASACHDAK